MSHEQISRMLDVLWKYRLFYGLVYLSIVIFFVYYWFKDRRKTNEVPK